MSAREKQNEAFNLRRKGYSFREIQTALGYASVSAAHKAFRVAFDSAIPEPATVIQMRTLEGHRLDELYRLAHGRAQRGDLNAIAACLRIIETRARIMGLNPPVKLEHTGADGTPLMEPEAVANTLLDRLSSLARRRRQGESDSPTDGEGEARAPLRVEDMGEGGAAPTD